MMVKIGIYFLLLLRGGNSAATAVATNGMQHFSFNSATLFVGKIKTSKQISHFPCKFLHLLEIDTTWISVYFMFVIVVHRKANIFLRLLGSVVARIHMRNPIVGVNDRGDSWSTRTPVAVGPTTRIGFRSSRSTAISNSRTTVSLRDSGTSWSLKGPGIGGSTTMSGGATMTMITLVMTVKVFPTRRIRRNRSGRGTT